MAAPTVCSCLLIIDHCGEKKKHYWVTYCLSPLSWFFSIIVLVQNRRGWQKGSRWFQSGLSWGHQLFLHFRKKCNRSPSVTLQNQGQVWFFFKLHITSMADKNTTQASANSSSQLQDDASRGVQITVTLLIFLVRNVPPEVIYKTIMVLKKKLHD